MAARDILKLGDPRLRYTSDAVPIGELRTAAFRQLIRDLIDTMRAANGAGLAAPQIGVPKQVCVIEVHHNPRYPAFPEIPLCVLINPSAMPLVESHDVLAEHEAISVYEGCLSVPGLRGRVTRPRRVRVRALDADGGEIDQVWAGAKAAIVQHELDHLHGLLFVDRVDSSTLCFTEEYDRHVAPNERVIDGIERPPTTPPRVKP